jgi:hypothetical protein
MLMGIYSTENNIIDVINTFHIEKAQEGRKKKHKVIEVEVARIETREKIKIKKKSQKSNKVRKVTFQHAGTPNEDDANIGANEVTTLVQKKKKQEKQKTQKNYAQG